VLDSRLQGRPWVMDDYSIADISMIGWVRNIPGNYNAAEIVGYDAFKNVQGWLERALARPAVQRGLDIPKRP
jgi:GST-like protein